MGSQTTLCLRDGYTEGCIGFIEVSPTSSLTLFRTNSL